jgi:TrpR-related protein YerC/YecD
MREFNWNKKENRQLIQALLSLKNTKEAELFLRDLMTEKELQEFANRFEAALQLSRNVQYDTIIKDTGLSSTTIARISKWLKGPAGGYRLVLNRFHHNNPKLRKGLSLNT